MERFDGAALAKLVPVLDEAANKYTRGKLRLFAGTAAYPGAACLAAVASQRAGAGYTEVFTDPPIVPLVQAHRASLVVRPFDAWDRAAEQPSEARHPHAYAAGSGFDPADEDALRMVGLVLDAAQAPVLVDGGGLQALVDGRMREACLRRGQAGFATILTPHGGEAARLAGPLGIAVEDPSALATDLAQAYAAVVVLKGPDTFISDGGNLYLMDEGGPMLAKAGTGDVLAGIIGGLLAQGVQPFGACVLGTVLHARAANVAAEQLDELSVCAEDVITCLPETLRAVRNCG